jgi:hypothetical protein
MEKTCIHILDMGIMDMEIMDMKIEWNGTAEMEWNVVKMKRKTMKRNEATWNRKKGDGPGR